MNDAMLQELSKLCSILEPRPECDHCVECRRASSCAQFEIEFLRGEVLRLRKDNAELRRSQRKLNKALDAVLLRSWCENEVDDE